MRILASASVFAPAWCPHGVFQVASLWESLVTTIAYKVFQLKIEVHTVHAIGQIENFFSHAAFACFIPMELYREPTTEKLPDSTWKSEMFPTVFYFKQFKPRRAGWDCICDRCGKSFVVGKQKVPPPCQPILRFCCLRVILDLEVSWHATNPKLADVRCCFRWRQSRTFAPPPRSTARRGRTV